MDETKRLEIVSDRFVKQSEIVLFSSLRSFKLSEANLVRITCCPWTTGCIEQEPVQALEAVQNTRLTAKKAISTQGVARLGDPDGPSYDHSHR